MNFNKIKDNALFLCGRLNLKTYGNYFLALEMRPKNIHVQNPINMRGGIHNDGKRYNGIYKS